jgi:putative aminopeptidase FrvX
MIDKNYVLDFAKKVLGIPSPSGFTHNVIKAIENECLQLGLSYTKTKKGNLIITMNGKTDYKLGLSAHVDTLGAVVRSIKSDGSLAFEVVGGPLLNTYDGEYCTIHTRNGKMFTGTFLSTSPSVHVYEDARTKERTPKNMEIRLDEIVKSKADTIALGITNGDFISVDPKVVITENNFIKSRFLDDKISVAILFGLIKYLKDNSITPKYHLTFIISANEEVGHGASHIPVLDEMIAVDMGCIGQDLSCTEYDVSICAKDSSGPYNYEVISKLVDTAKTNNINYAIDIYPFYGSDVSAALKAGHDFKGGLIGPGVHASHGMERTHYKAVEATIKLLVEYIK